VRAAARPLLSFRRVRIGEKVELALIRKDLMDLKKKKRVEDDMAEAKSLGITGTPGFFVNGRYLNGAKPFNDFAARKAS
jgi:protein-disulfide isomerase